MNDNDEAVRMALIDHELGYNAFDEAIYREIDLETVLEERRALARMDLKEALRIVQDKKRRLRAVYTSEAAIFYDVSPNKMLRWIRDGKVRAFKSHENRWKVWIVG